MKTKLAGLWQYLDTSFWFVPTLMVCFAIGLSVVMVEVDQAADGSPGALAWTYARGPEGARATLETIAGSMITVAGVVFSITVVALQLASSQFGPRLLYNFRRDTTNQVVLGTFIATFVYCLLVLRTIQGGEDDTSVRTLSVTVGIGLALASLAVLIYFIHHIAGLVQAENVVAAVGAELERAIERLFPIKAEPRRRDPPTGDDSDHANRFGSAACTIKAPDAGYLQLLDMETLLELATRHDLLLKLEYRPGQFIVQGADIIRVWPRPKVDPALGESIAETFTVGAQRTLTQDVEFPVEQLVEISLRALSPGINDPFTAVRCLDQLSAALCRLAQRDMPSPYVRDRAGELRIITHPVTFAGIVDAAFNQIRQAARTNAAVTIRLLETIEMVIAQVRDKCVHDALLRQAAMTVRGSGEGLPEQWDRDAVVARFQRVESAFKAARFMPSE